MTLLAPWFLAAGALAAAAVVALHFLAWGRPPEAVLPTARFVPDRPARAAARATAPADLLLLALRVLLVLLVALALAAPVRSASGRGVRRVILADVSNAVRAPAEVRDSVRSLARPGDIVIAFDTLARTVGAGSSGMAPDSASERVEGALSVALVAALRAAPALRSRAESLELVIVSPLAASEMDAATGELRALWKGRARLVRVGAAISSGPTGIEIADAAGGATGDAGGDPVVAALGLVRARDGAAVRVLRRAPRAEDHEWATGEGRVLVEWPRDSVPSGWQARAPWDTSGAVVAGDVVAIGPFARRWRAEARPAQATIVARWPDGEAAATESRTSGGCIRQIGFNPPDAGDAALRPGFLALLGALFAPCGGDRAAALSLAEATRLAGTGPLLATALMAPAPDRRSALSPWLLGVALALLAAEHVLRDRLRAK